MEIRQVVNANVYINGNDYLGRVEEIELPKLKTKTSERKTLGMVGTVELPVGFEKMEAKVKWAAPYEDVFALTANPYKTVLLQCRSNVEKHTTQGRTEEIPMVTHIGGYFKEHDGGSNKHQENSTYETPMAVNYFKQVVNGVEQVEFDVFTNTLKVNGEDVLAKYRSNIGGNSGFGTMGFLGMGA